MAPHSSTLAWEIHGRRSLVGCSPRGREELDTTERLHFHFSLSCIGEGNGNPLQCSCLENPRDGGAWWAAVYGVAQSRTWLKRLSSSSSNQNHYNLWFLFLLKYLQHSTTWWPDSILSVTDVCPHMSLCPVQGVGRQVMRPRLSQHLLGFRRFSFLGSVLLPA